MQFQTIDKTRYRQRYKTVSYVLVSTLVILSLSLSALLVALLGEVNSGDNFWLNLSGVGIAAILSAGLLLSYKSHPYLAELSYIWDLKQTLNQINRRLRKVRDAAEQGDTTALLILQYYYAGCEQLWTLDDNTLVMPELKEWQAQLQRWLKQFNVTVDVIDYRREMLLSFK